MQNTMSTLDTQKTTGASSAPDGRVGSGPLFGQDDLHLGAPFCIVEAYALMCRELDRKQGMIEDLHQYANDNCGMGPEDCELLMQTVADRDNLKVALTAMRALFA